MKKLLEKILLLLNLNNKDEEVVLKYVEKKEKGLEVSEKEKKEVLQSAIRLTKETKVNED